MSNALISSNLYFLFYVDIDNFVILLFYDPTMLCALGGKPTMAASEEDLCLTANLKSSKDVSKLGKGQLKKIVRA